MVKTFLISNFRNLASVYDFNKLRWSIIKISCGPAFNMDCDLMIVVKEHASTVRNRTGKVRFARAMPTTNPRTGMLWERDCLIVHCSYFQYCRAATRALIEGVYSYIRLLLDELLLKSVVIRVDFKKIRRAKLREYMNIHHQLTL